MPDSLLVFQGSPRSPCNCPRAVLRPQPDRFFGKGHVVTQSSSSLIHEPIANTPQNICLVKEPSPSPCCYITRSPQPSCSKHRALSLFHSGTLRSKSAYHLNGHGRSRTALLDLDSLLGGRGHWQSLLRSGRRPVKVAGDRS